MRRILNHLSVALFALIIVPGLAAFEADFGLALEARNDSGVPNPGVFERLGITLAHSGYGFDFIAEMQAANDGKYPLLNEPYANFYPLLIQGGLSYRNGPFSASAGRFRQKDIVDSPYSLFVSSEGLSALGAQIGYDDERFFFLTKWISLNANSSLFTMDIPIVSGTSYLSKPFDRGVEYKVYGLHLGKFRFAYLDAEVYTGRSFDVEQFFNPSPGFFLQYAKSTPGPWEQGSAWEPANENYMGGFLLDYTTPDLYAYGQILIDDVNSNRLFHPDRVANPDKIALSGGGRLKTDIGTFGAFAALSTKYTFEPVGAAGTNTEYGYNYYPDLRFPTGSLLPEEDNVGLYLGEDVFALRGAYDTTLHGVDLDSSLELALSGPQSPTNPWAQFVYFDDAGAGVGTHLLDDPIIERRLTLRAAASYVLSAWRFEANFRGGYVWNELELSDPATLPGFTADSANTLWLYYPSSTSRFFGFLSLGVTYALGSR